MFSHHVGVVYFEERSAWASGAFVDYNMVMLIKGSVVLDENNTDSPNGWSRQVHLLHNHCWKLSSKGHALVVGFRSWIVLDGLPISNCWVLCIHVAPNCIQSSHHGKTKMSCERIFSFKKKTKKGKRKAWRSIETQMWPYMRSRLLCGVLRKRHLNRPKCHGFCCALVLQSIYGKPPKTNSFEMYACDT